MRIPVKYCLLFSGPPYLEPDPKAKDLRRDIISSPSCVIAHLVTRSPKSWIRSEFFTLFYHAAKPSRFFSLDLMSPSVHVVTRFSSLSLTITRPKTIFCLHIISLIIALLSFSLFLLKDYLLRYSVTLFYKFSLETTFLLSLDDYQLVGLLPMVLHHHQPPTPPPQCIIAHHAI